MSSSAFWDDNMDTRWQHGHVLPTKPEGVMTMSYIPLLKKLEKKQQKVLTLFYFVSINMRIVIY